VIVRRALNFPAARIDPWVPSVVTLQDFDQQIVAINLAQCANPFNRSTFTVDSVPLSEQVLERDLVQIR